MMQFHFDKYLTFVVIYNILAKKTFIIIFLFSLQKSK